MPSLPAFLINARGLKAVYGRYWLSATYCLTLFGNWSVPPPEDGLTARQMTIVRAWERQRIEVIDQVSSSVISIYGDQRQGGGSGVIIDPSGIGLTNHHVIMGAGVRGLGGLSDGQLYSWELIGTDPGGDVAVIQLRGRDNFPFAPLADSDRVQVGDWVLAMGNPFMLTEDQTPTVTLGIVSGVKRFQPGAGMNQLIYGNCIQTDSSINPGNSGGPLFNLQGQVIGINGRGSFEQRGRVNVGLGYAISANQIKNFLPDLLATKLVEHGTLDASFEDRRGKVVCANLYEDSKLYLAGVRPGDQLLEFEGETISSANQFTNLICTLPEDWPAQLKIRKDDGSEMNLTIRLYGLPYPKPRIPPAPPDQREPTPEQREQEELLQAMIDLLSATPGTIRDETINQRYARLIVDRWTRPVRAEQTVEFHLWRIRDEIFRDQQPIGEQSIWVANNGDFAVSTILEGQESSHFWNSGKLFELRDGKAQMVDCSEIANNPAALQAIGILNANGFEAVDHLPSWTLHGSDKALRRPASRLQRTSDQLALMFWLGMMADGEATSVELLKVGADADGNTGIGAIVFYDWNRRSGLNCAGRRMLVRGLDERVVWSFRAQEVVLESDTVVSDWQRIRNEASAKSNLFERD